MSKKTVTKDRRGLVWLGSPQAELFYAKDEKNKAPKCVYLTNDGECGNIESKWYTVKCRFASSCPFKNKENAMVRTVSRAIPKTNTTKRPVELSHEEKFLKERLSMVGTRVYHKKFLEKGKVVFVESKYIEIEFERKGKLTLAFDYCIQSRLITLIDVEK